MAKRIAIVILLLALLVVPAAAQCEDNPECDDAWAPGEPIGEPACLGILLPLLVIWLRPK